LRYELTDLERSAIKLVLDHLKVRMFRRIAVK